MFNEKTCKRCGACLTQCPVMELDPDQAKAEIANLIDNRPATEFVKNCIGCGFCDTLCPTGSQPSALRKEIMDAQPKDSGASGMVMICEEVPGNLMDLALMHDREKKEAALAAFTNPPHSETVFYLGCSLSHIYTDLTQTTLLSDYPMVGGMKYCCGGYVHRNFGDKEAIIKGQTLLGHFRATGVKKIITFCPGCDRMLQDVYPAIVPDFDIEVQNISDFLLEKHRSGNLDFPNKLNRTVAFQDSCGWRSIDPSIYEAPRQLLAAMGATVVEMAHNRKQSICCGAPLNTKNPALGDKLAKKRADEAKAAGADTISVACTGCFAVNKKASEQGIDVYNITELAQIAIGETPPHRIAEATDALRANIIKTFTENPSLMTDKYTIENGKVIKL